MNNKFKLAVILTTMAFQVNAAEFDNSVKVSGVFNDYERGVNKEGFNLQYTRDNVYTKGLFIDGKMELRTDANEGLSNRIEAGVGYKHGIYGDLSGFVRVSSGLRFGSNNTYGYYTVEPGLKYTLTDNWSTSISYRYRDAFENVTGAMTHRGQIGAAYKLTDRSEIGASISHSWGDVDYNQYAMSYSYKF